MKTPSQWIIVAAALLSGATACGQDAAHAERRAGETRTAPAATTRSSDGDAATIATVLELRGDVRIQRAGSERWSSLSADTTIGANDTIQAMSGGSAKLRVTATSTVLDVTSGTTIRLDASSSGARAVSGRLVAHLADDQRPRRFELSLPPCVLVLTTEPGRPVAEAAIDVGETSTSVEVRVGQAELRASTGNTVPIGERRWVRFHPAGTVIEQGGAGPVAELVSPADGAALRVRKTVELRWSPVEGADHYRVVLRMGDVARKIDAAEPRLDVSVATGEYQWAVHAIDGDLVWPSSVSRRVIVEVDDRPPVLTVTEPVAGTSISGPIVRFAGRSEPGVVIEIGKRKAVADARGQFSLDVEIKRGLTNLVVVARDDLGNTRKVTRSVVWE